MHFDEKMSGIWPENHEQGINFPWFSWTFYPKLGGTSLPKLKSSTPPPSLGLSFTLPVVDKSTVVHCHRRVTFYWSFENILLADLPTCDIGQNLGVWKMNRKTPWDLGRKPWDSHKSSKGKKTELVMFNYLAMAFFNCSQYLLFRPSGPRQCTADAVFLCSSIAFR